MLAHVGLGMSSVLKAPSPAGLTYACSRPAASDPNYMNPPGSDGGSQITKELQRRAAAAGYADGDRGAEGPSDVARAIKRISDQLMVPPRGVGDGGSRKTPAAARTTSSSAIGCGVAHWVSAGSIHANVVARFGKVLSTTNSLLLQGAAHSSRYYLTPSGRVKESDDCQDDWT